MGIESFKILHSYLKDVPKDASGGGCWGVTSLPYFFTGKITKGSMLLYFLCF